MSSAGLSAISETSVKLLRSAAVAAQLISWAVFGCTPHFNICWTPVGPAPPRTKANLPVTLDVIATGAVKPVVWPRPLKAVLLI